jgi:hypothetical protein
MPRSSAADQTLANSEWKWGMPFVGTALIRNARLPRARMRVSSATTQSRSV